MTLFLPPYPNINHSHTNIIVVSTYIPHFRPAVCLFYLILRALDTIEDDMTIPNDVKISILKSFHTYLYDSHWRYMDSKERDRAVLEDFPQVS